MLPRLLGRLEQVSNHRFSEGVQKAAMNSSVEKSIVDQVRDALEAHVGAANMSQEVMVGASSDIDSVQALVRCGDLGGYILLALRRRFDSFCQPGNSTLTEEGFQRLMAAAQGCCPQEAATAFFHAFASSSADDSTGACWRQAAATALRGRGPQATAMQQPPAQQKTERRLTFPEFVRGVCAADPQDTLSIYQKAPYLKRFFAVAPKLIFKFDASLLQVRWTTLRPALLAAHRGAPEFTCLHALYTDYPDIFRSVVAFL